MNAYDPKRLVGNAMPSYKILNNNPKSEMGVELLQAEETKYWSVKALYILAVLQMLFGVFLCAAQLVLNNNICSCIGDSLNMQKLELMYPEDLFQTSFKEVICVTSTCTTRTYAFWCGGIIFLSGLLSCLATKYKTNFLLVVSSFLCVVEYGVSICCLILSAVYAQMELDTESRGGTLVTMALISGLNFFVSVLTSAFFCRASCSCCQPHAPAVMYLSSPKVSTTHQQPEIYAQA